MCLLPQHKYGAVTTLQPILHFSLPTSAQYRYRQAERVTAQAQACASEGNPALRPVQKGCCCRPGARLGGQALPDTAAANTASTSPRSTTVPVQATASPTAAGCAVRQGFFARRPLAGLHTAMPLSGMAKTPRKTGQAPSAADCAVRAQLLNEPAPGWPTRSSAAARQNRHVRGGSATPQRRRPRVRHSFLTPRPSAGQRMPSAGVQRYQPTVQVRPTIKVCCKPPPQLAVLSVTAIQPAQHETERPRHSKRSVNQGQRSG